MTYYTGHITGDILHGTYYSCQIALDTLHRTYYTGHITQDLLHRTYYPGHITHDLSTGGSKRHSLHAVELVTAVTNCCANCVEASRPHQWGPNLPFLGQAGHANLMDGWRCSSQKRVISRLIQVRQH